MTFCLLAHELKAQGKKKKKQRFYYFFLCLMQILAEHLQCK